MKKQFSASFKAEVIRELLQETKTFAQISSERGVAPTQLSQWKQIALKGLPSLFEDGQREIEQLKQKYAQEQEQLYAEIGRITSELSWMKKKLAMS